jgi:predicted RNase H-like HicB family nuclease
VWVADVVGLDGAWAEGPTRAVAVQNLQSVIYEWVTMKLDDGDRDIPQMDGLRLVPEE